MFRKMPVAEYSFSKLSFNQLWTLLHHEWTHGNSRFSEQFFVEFLLNYYFKFPYDCCSGFSLAVWKETAICSRFAIFTGKRLCWSLFWIKLQDFWPATLLKKTPTQVFFCEYCEIFKNSFFYRTILVAASGIETFFSLWYITLKFMKIVWHKVL